MPVVRSGSEDDLNVFTAGVCLSAALAVGGDTVEFREAIGRIGQRYPLLPELYRWALSAQSLWRKEADREAFLTRMVTRGGVTEAIVGSLMRGEPLDRALEAGIARTRELSRLAEESIESILSKLNQYKRDTQHFG